MAPLLGDEAGEAAILTVKDIAYPPEVILDDLKLHARFETALCRLSKKKKKN